MNPDLKQFEKLVNSLNDKAPSLAGAINTTLTFDDGVSVKITLHSDYRHIVLEAEACNIALLVGAVRQSIVNALLSLNYFGITGRPFFVGLNTRDSVVVYVKTELGALDDRAFINTVDYCRKQTRNVSRLVSSLLPVVNVNLN